MPDDTSHLRAAAARDLALARLRRLTGGAVGAAVVLSGIFAGLAASSTHPRKVIRRYRVPASVPRKTVEPPLPAPRQPSLGDEAAPPPAAPAPPPAAPAPAPVTSPPVVVSGGS